MLPESQLLKFLTNNFRSVDKVDTSVFKKRGLKYAFSFVNEIEGREATLILGIAEDFPLSLPLFFIKDYEEFPFIPHVEDDGFVCYTHDDNVFIDYTDPERVVLECLQLARQTIIAGLRGENKVDFINEFEAYWLRLKDGIQIYGNLDLSAGPSQIKIGVQKDLSFAVSEEFLEKTKRFINVAEKGVTYENGIYLPLKKGFHPDVPRSNEPISFDYFKKLLTGVSSKDAKELRRLTSRSTKAKEFVIVSFEQPDGLKSLFGFQFSGSTAHPILSEEFHGKVRPISIQRLDKEYLIRRGGNGETYFNKKGLVIGCGSVGGFIIEELTRTGFTDLTIIDDDRLSQENSYRHFLGFEFLYQPKVDAIKKRIEKIFPHSDIEAINDRIERLVRNRKIDFSSYQFIIVATGNVTVNHYLNELLISKFPGLPIVFAWNDPYGIGGHVLVANVRDGGCYQCLYDNEHRHNRASFADRDQPKQFLKSLSGCGTSYTPFSSIDSRSTACLAVKMVSGVLTGHQKQNSLSSWKGDNRLFISEGFKLSPRYNMSENQLTESGMKFESHTCNICHSVAQRV